MYNLHHLYCACTDLSLVNRFLAILLCQIHGVISSCSEMVQQECLHLQGSHTWPSLLDDVHEVCVCIDKCRVDPTLASVKAVCRGVDRVSHCLCLLAAKELCVLLGLVSFESSQEGIVHLVIGIERFCDQVWLQSSGTAFVRGGIVMEVVVVSRDTKRCLGYDDGSDAQLGLHGTAGAESDDDHVAFDDSTTFADEEVDDREAHTDGNDGNGYATKGSGEGEEVTLRVEFEERLAAVKGLGDSVCSDLVADSDLGNSVQNELKESRVSKGLRLCRDEQEQEKGLTMRLATLIRRRAERG